MNTTSQTRINKLNSDSKKSMKQRVVSSIIMATFFVILFLFAILSDNVNSWAPLKNNLIGKQITAFLLLFMFLPIIFIISKEINDILFKKKIVVLLCIFFFMIGLIYTPTFIYFLSNYKLINLKSIIDTNQPLLGLNITNIFAIAISIFVFILLMINLIILKVNNQLTFKNYLILTLLIGLSSGFFLGVFFFNFKYGWMTLLFLFLISIMMDSFAYFGGILFGKKKMAPIISPKKTWEGFAIGLFSTILLSLIIAVIYAFADSQGNSLTNIIGSQYQFVHSNNISRTMYQWWLPFITIVIVLSIISVFGDLTFSIFKRQYKIKDYGNLIPGHGGILDRIDSHAFLISSFMIISMFMSLFSKTSIF